MAETEFVRNEELKFLARARRDKLFAAWAADRLGRVGQARAHLVADLLAVRGYPHHDRALLARLAEAAPGAIPAEETAAVLAQFGHEAFRQVFAGEPAPTIN